MTEKNVEDIENQSLAFSEKIGEQIMLETMLEAAQREKNNSDTASYYKDIAIGYVHAANIKNERLTDGMDYWDTSWGYFNKARLEIMSNTRTNYSYTTLQEISFEMAKALMSQYKDSKPKQNRILAQIAIAVAEYHKYDDSPWISDEIYEIGKKAILKGELTDVEQEQIYSKAVEDIRLNSIQSEKFREVIEKIRSYVVFK